jgi:hypothetical protein
MGKPKPEDPKYQEFYDKIIAAKKDGPVELEGEKKGDDKERGWLLDEALFNGLLDAIPYSKDKSKNRRNLQDLPIGSMKGWLNLKAKGPLVKTFKSVPIDQEYGKTKPKNYTGILTYQGCFVIWRHAIHHSHEAEGGGPDTGTYDAIEGFKLTGDIASVYVKAKMK